MKDREEGSRDVERALSVSSWKELALRRRMRELCYENKGMRIRIGKDGGKCQCGGGGRKQ